MIAAFPAQSRADGISEYGQESPDPDEIYITVPFHAPGFGRLEYEFPYSDNYFRSGSGEFSRSIAKASCGLTVSAFAMSSTKDVPLQYETYLGEAGFQDIYAFGFDSERTKDTLAGVIAHKNIGDFTLIAAAACGQGYKKEWAGNLELGTGERHKGFQTAAEIFERELEGYINKYEISGETKLWLAGYSRGAAAANLTAADEIESGKFGDVYAYLYGVPNTTKNPVDYSGIYNICGAYDPAALLAFQSWGFGRYGTTLYLPAAETNIRYPLLSDRASHVCYRLTGDIIRHNPELNYQLHLLLESVAELFPDSEEFVEKMQDKIMELWDEINLDKVTEIITSILPQLERLDERQEYASQIFIEYFTNVVLQKLKDSADSTELRDIVWNDEQSLSNNLFREHWPYVYISWIFSDIPDEDLFGGADTARRVVIFGDVGVEIWRNGIFAGGYTGTGEYISKEENFAEDIFIAKNGTETIIFMPYDESAQVRIIADDRADVIWYEAVCELDKTFGSISEVHTVLMEEGTYYLDFLPEMPGGSLIVMEGRIISQDAGVLEYSPTMIMSLELEAHENETIGSLLIPVFVITGAALLILLACLIIAIIHKARKKEHGPYSVLYVIVPHLILFALFTALTLYCTANLHLITLARMACAGISMLIIFLLALRGLLRNKNVKNIVISAIILLAGILNCLVYQKSGDVSSAPLQSAIYCLAMAAIAGLALLTFRYNKKDPAAQK